MKIQFNLFPNGVSRALTMSYDDGQIHDLHLTEIFNRYGIKGTFHLNSGNIGRQGYLTDKNISEDLKGHEISLHTKTHPFLTRLPDSMAVMEIMEDRLALEAAAGYPIVGMSYPFGDYDAHTIELLRTCGIKYSRTVKNTGKFDIPADFMEWHPTAHHNDGLTGLWEQFQNQKTDRMLLFYIWGHSFEFPARQNWDVMENFCRTAGGRTDIWYATNIEIYRYVTAQRNLIFSADRSTVYNPASIDVWFTAENREICVHGGETLSLQ